MTMSPFRTACFAASITTLSKPAVHDVFARPANGSRRYICRRYTTCSISHSDSAASATSVPTDTSTQLPNPITFIGAGGNMAAALINGLASSAPPDLEIRAASPRMSSLTPLPLPASSLFTDNITASSGAAMVILCVKPHIAPDVLEELRPLLTSDSPPAVLSVIAGLPTTAIESLLAHDPTPPILRAMPNLPAAYGAGVTGLCRGSGATVAHEDAAAAVLTAVGTVERIPERLFAALTAVSGAGVAYVFMMAEALSDAAVAHGLPRPLARRLAADTVAGAGAVLRGGEHAAILRNMVESPGGVTIAGTSELERAGLRGAILDAVDAAVEKVRDMGEE